MFAYRRPNFTKTMQPFLKILKMAGYIPDRLYINMWSVYEIHSRMLNGTPLSKPNGILSKTREYCNTIYVCLLSYLLTDLTIPFLPLLFTSVFFLSHYYYYYYKNNNDDDDDALGSSKVDKWIVLTGEKSC